MQHRNYREKNCDTSQHILVNAQEMVCVWTPGVCVMKGSLEVRVSAPRTTPPAFRRQVVGHSVLEWGSAFVDNASVMTTLSTLASSVKSVW